MKTRDMTASDLRTLPEGSIVRHRLSGNAYVVIQKHQVSLTAVRSVELSSAHEWLVIVDKDDAAYPSPALNLRVKQLEWKDYPGSRLTGENKERYGFHEFGSYLITRDGGFYSLSTFTNMGAMRPMGDFKQLDDATGAAQADFDQRVLSIVTPTPAPNSEALVP